MSTWTPRQEHERLPGGPIACVVAVSLVLLAAAIGAAGLLFPLRSPPGPVGRAPRVLGGVEQTLLEGAGRGPALAAEQRKVLDRYAWIDRDAGTARIPIDRAIDLVIAVPPGDGGNP